jgi:Uma2 family endonuclease
MSGATSTKMTYEDLLKMPETNRFEEIIDGELIVSPGASPLHQTIVLRIARAIADYLDNHPIGRVFIAPLDVVLAQDQVLEPDVLYVSNERAGFLKQHVMGPPDLAVEVLSPHSHRRDKVRKRQLYEQYGVTEYWIVDPDGESVEVFRAESGKYRGIVVHDTLTTPLLPGLAIDLRKLFAAQ